MGATGSVEEQLTAMARVRGTRARYIGTPGDDSRLVGAKLVPRQGLNLDLVFAKP